MLFIAAMCASVMLAFSGCGLETEQANRKLKRANEQHARAEAALQNFKRFPDEWQAIFNVPRITAAQIDAAGRLLQARMQDLTSIEAALKEWGEALRPILALNVEDKVKEYVRLKRNAVKCYTEYTAGYLRPIMKAYEVLLNNLATGRPPAEVERAAREITALVNDSVPKLEECNRAEKHAQDFFDENDVGE